MAHAIKIAASLNKKIVVLFSLTVLPVLFIFYRNFIYTRTGWHMQSIQYETIYWIVRVALCPFIVWLMIRYWEELGNLFSLIYKQACFFIAYLFLFWSLSCLLAANFTIDFDGRYRNLINTIKSESFLLTILVYSLTASVVYLWIYYDKEKDRKKINDG